MAQASKLVETVLQNAPDDVEALIVKAQIEATAGRREEAIKLYERAIAGDPRSLAARFALVSLAVLTGKHDIAKAQVAKMKELQANDFRTLYSDALVSYVTGNAQHAHEVVERLVAARPDHLPSVFLSGLVDFQLGSNASAEVSLRKVLARSPKTLTRGGSWRSSICARAVPPTRSKCCGPCCSARPTILCCCAQRGEAYLASGNAKLAAASYERATAVDKGDVTSKVRLAQARLAGGETERAFGDLQSLANADPTDTQADLAIITEYIRRRQYDKALAAVDALEKKQPKAALPSVLRGSVYLAKRDLVNARKSYEHALELEPEFFSAAFSLALLDIREGRPQAARDRFDRILAKNPKNEQALLASSGIAAVDGRNRRRGQGVAGKGGGGESCIGSSASCADQRRSAAPATATQRWLRRARRCRRSRTIRSCWKRSDAASWLRVKPTRAIERSGASSTSSRKNPSAYIRPGRRAGRREGLSGRDRKPAQGARAAARGVADRREAREDLHAGRSSGRRDRRGAQVAEEPA